MVKTAMDVVDTLRNIDGYIEDMQEKMTMLDFLAWADFPQTKAFFDLLALMRIKFYEDFQERYEANPNDQAINVHYLAGQYKMITEIIFQLNALIEGQRERDANEQEDSD